MNGIRLEKHLDRLKSINKAKKERSLIKLEKAYSEWLLDKHHIKMIAKQNHVDPSHLTNLIKERGHRLESFNINIFDNIDTEEKAYWLGFIFADGYVSNEYRSEISLKRSDFEHLYKFTNFIDCNREISIDKYRCRFSFGSKHTVKRLIELGCVPRKSLVLKFPKIDISLYRHFIRGYFDGDGSITVSSREDVFYNQAILASGSESFIISIIDIIKNSILPEYNQIPYKSKNANIYSITFKNKYFYTFMDWLYKDATIYLDRKYRRYKNAMLAVM